MGAGASIEDEKDLEKEYNKAKENGTINDDQAAKLKAEYDSIKADPKKGSNEFLVIGKCKKKWDEVV
eukprot:g2843.t1